jgi:hypothetical protein
VRASNSCLLCLVHVASGLFLKLHLLRISKTFSVIMAQRLRQKLELHTVLSKFGPSSSEMLEE